MRDRSDEQLMKYHAGCDMAQRELAAHSRRKSTRWFGAFATASVFVLAFAIVVQQDSELVAPSSPSTDGLRVEELKKQDLGAPRAREAPAVSEIEAGELEASEAEEWAAAPKDAESTQLEAEEWVERLLLLRRSELYEKLEAELEAFRKAYPDYPLPPELAN